MPEIPVKSRLSGIFNKAREQGMGRQEKNDFCRFPQRDYDFDALEKQLVNNIKED